VLDFDGELRITDYHEKPALDYHVYLGIYVYEPCVLQYIEGASTWIFQTWYCACCKPGKR